MRSLLLAILLVGVLYAPSFAEVQHVAAKPAARSDEKTTDQMVGENPSSRGNTQRSARSNGTTQEFGIGYAELNPRAERWPDQESRSEREQRRIYDFTPSIATTAATTQEVSDCDCCDDCQCADPMICKQGDCKKTYLLFFTAKWCPACRKMYAAIEQLRNEGYIVYVLDVDDFPDAAEKCRAKMLPTFVIMSNGEEITRFVGITDIEKLRVQLKTRDEQAEQTDQPKPYDFK